MKLRAVTQTCFGASCLQPHQTTGWTMKSTNPRDRCEMWLLHLNQDSKHLWQDCQVWPLRKCQLQRSEWCEASPPPFLSLSTKPVRHLEVTADGTYPQQWRRPHAEFLYYYYDNSDYYSWIKALTNIVPKAPVIKALGKRERERESCPQEPTSASGGVTWTECLTL